MNYKMASFSFLLLFISIFSRSAYAEEKSYDVDFEAYTGRSYDSNVSIDQIDLTSRVGDHATNSGIKASLGNNFSDKLSGNAGISISDINYDTYSAFDLRTTLASANMAYALPKKVKLGMGVYHAQADLDGSTFLKMTQFSPNLSWFASKSNFFRFSVTRSSKTFDGRPLRDSDNTAIGADWFHFLNGSKNFISVGYDFKKEDAEDAIYDYDTHILKLAWTRKFQLFEADSKIKTGIKKEHRAYDDSASGGTTARKDKRLRAFFEFEQQVFTKGFVNFEYVWSDYNSNVDAQTYDQRITKLTLGIKL